MSSRVLDRLVKFLVAKKDKPIPEVFVALELAVNSSNGKNFEYDLKVEPGWISVLQMEAGTKGEIVLIAPHQKGRMERLTALGIVAGNLIELVQKYPSLVVKVDQTEIALDKGIAGGIWVKNCS